MKGLAQPFDGFNQNSFQTTVFRLYFGLLVARLSTKGEGMIDNPFERRSAERRYALNFLEYEVLSATDEVIGRGMARTLNVSESGLRLETSEFFEAGQKLRITLGLKNDMVQLCGQVMNSEPEDELLCSTGVMFVEFSSEDRSRYSHYFDALRQVTV